MSREFDFIDWIRAQQRPSDLIQLPAGDDLAVLRWNAADLLLVGVDQVLDGIHFNSKVHSPRRIGMKVMNRNLSDCAAMACLPAAALISAALPKGCGIEYAKELYLGIKQAADVFDCEIIGGETGSWDAKLAVSVTIIARSGGIEPITRRGAKAGNSIYVTGALGGSLLKRHMEFIPRVHEARALAQTGLVTAMIDLSDGLSRDLRHICQQSGVGASINARQIPIHPDAIEMRNDGRPPLEHALHDGEDYELLFTAERPHNSLDAAATRIGIVTSEPGLWLVNDDGTRVLLEPKAWEHTF